MVHGQNFKKMKKRIISAVFLLIWGNCLWAQAGSLDSTFGVNGTLFFEKTFPFPPYGLLTTIDNSNRIVVAQSSETDSNLLMVRFLEGGAVDPDFGQNGEVVLVQGLPFNIWSMAVQNDNKILVVGGIHDPVDTMWGYISNIFIARFLENGQPDPSFGFQGAVTIDLDTNAVGLDLAVQDDGSILVTGRLGIINWGGGGNTDVFLLRLLPNGSFDSSFGNAGIVITDLNAIGFDVDMGEKIVVQPDGKILVSGINGLWGNGEGDLALIRYQPNGTLDAFFGNDGIVISKADVPQYRKILLSNDQSILVAGHEGSVFGGGLYATLRKFKPNGEVDSMFADNGIIKTEMNDNGRAFSDIELQADNKIVAAGFWGDEGLGKSLLMRFFPDGKPDSTFGIYAMTRLEMENCNSGLHHLWFTPDQKITALGGCADYWADSVFRFFLARFNNDLSNSIKNPGLASNLTVFPNPASERIIFLFENTVSGSLTFSRSDGTVIFTENLTAEKQHQISVTSMPNGMYFWKWVGSKNGELASGKVLVVR